MVRFQVNDKVVCVDDSPDFTPFGLLPNHLKKGQLYVVHDVYDYNVRGTCLRVEPHSIHSYETRHFRLVARQ